MDCPHGNYDSYRWWQKRMTALQGQVPEAELQKLSWHVGRRDNFGYGQGETRDGKLGQWDVYYNLKELGCQHALLISGLTAEEVSEGERRDDLLANGVDPDDLSDVAAFEQLKGMSQEELSEEIERMEALLGDVGDVS